MKIAVDKLKLAQGLENGFCGPWSSKSIREFSLRLPFCGLMSTAVKIYLDQQGVDSELILCKQQRNDLRLSQEEHIFVSVDDESPDNPTIIDPTYSQFLNDAGLSLEYEKFISKDSSYPEDRVEVFSLRDRQLLANKMAACAIRFRENKTPSILDESMVDEMMDLSQKEIANQFVNIWDPRNFQPFTPDEATYSKAYNIAKHIPVDAIVAERKAI